MDNCNVSYSIFDYANLNNTSMNNIKLGKFPCLNNCYDR